jgi:hypothetical protein
VPAPFRFDRTWDLPATPSRLWEVLQGTGEYPRWWPWLREFETDGSGLVEGSVARCSVRAPIPYTLDFTVTIEHVEPGTSLDARVDGDLRGPARLEIGARAKGATARLVWTVELRAPMLRAASVVVRPVMEWGHDWIADSGVRQFRERALRSPD